MNNIKTYGQALFEAKQDTLNYYFIEAILKSDREKAIDMLEAGADPNAKASADQAIPGSGCLNILVGSKNTNSVKDFIRELVALGADPNMTDRNGSTPLHGVFLDARKWKFIDLLIELGADPNIKNNEGQTALERCLEYMTRYKGGEWIKDLGKIAKRLMLGGGIANPKLIFDAFDGDLGWWKNMPKDFMEKVNRINRTKSIFNV